jgi:superfamily II DNA/RNA helicase
VSNFQYFLTKLKLFILSHWTDAGFEEQIVKNIERSAYLRPRKIQSLTIPLIMDGQKINKII